MTVAISSSRSSTGRTSPAPTSRNFRTNLSGPRWSAVLSNAPLSFPSRTRTLQKTADHCGPPSFLDQIRGFGRTVVLRLPDRSGLARRQRQGDADVGADALSL